MTTAVPAASLPLSTILHQPVTDSDGRRTGVLSDLIIRLCHGGYPLVTGVVVTVGGTRAAVSAADLAALTPGLVQLTLSTGELREFRRGEGEVLLFEDVLGHRLIDVPRAALVKAHDVQLAPVPGGWAATGLDVHRCRWLGLGPRHAARDWKDFEPLIGHAASAHVRRAAARIPDLEPAQIADIIEEATADERAELLAHVHDHPELEADVFEELVGPF